MAAGLLVVDFHEKPFILITALVTAVPLPTPFCVAVSLHTDCDLKERGLASALFWVAIRLPADCDPKERGLASALL